MSSHALIYLDKSAANLKTRVGRQALTKIVANNKPPLRLIKGPSTTVFSSSFSTPSTKSQDNRIHATIQIKAAKTHYTSKQSIISLLDRPIGSIGQNPKSRGTKAVSLNSIP